MAIQFDRPARQTESAPKLTLPLPPEEAADPKPYDIQADRTAVEQALLDSPEIEELTSLLDVNDLSTITQFGAQTAMDLSKASDTVLKSMSMTQPDETSRMLRELSRIMDQFRMDELSDNPGLLGKLLGTARKKLDQILAKYNTMGGEVDRIYVELRQYEQQIRDSNTHLESMFNANVDYYHQLVKYIVAGERGCQEIRSYLDQRRADMAATGDQSILFEIQTLEQALQLLEQRVQDLRTAEMVALQSIPMLRTMEFSNVNLVRKINSAFIVTLPVFKQALAQAIMLKRQRIQAEAISALDQRTNELLLKNARNVTEQAKLTARLASGSSIKADTLESTWRTICSGIDETRRIQEQAMRQRDEDKAKLERIQGEYMRRISAK